MSSFKYTQNWIEIKPVSVIFLINKLNNLFLNFNKKKN